MQGIRLVLGDIVAGVDEAVGGSEGEVDRVLRREHDRVPPFAANITGSHAVQQPVFTFSTPIVTLRPSSMSLVPASGSPMGNR